MFFIELIANLQIISLLINDINHIKNIKLLLSNKLEYKSYK